MNNSFISRPFRTTSGASLVLVVASLAAQAAPGRESRRPNILVIMTDEHSAAVLGCYGNHIVRTPHLDRLAERGICFDAAYTNSPLCVPARLSFTAGKYASRVAAWHNNSMLPNADTPSIAGIMSKAGYESLLCGKMHFDRARRYGFREIIPAHTNGNLKTGKCQRRPFDALTPAVTDGGKRFKEPDFGIGEDSAVLKHDRRITDATVKFFRGRRPDDKPFFLILGYVAPHFPLVVPEKYYRAYEGRVPMPVIPPGHLESQPLNYQHLRVGFNVTAVPSAKVRQARELYYGLTQWVDEQIGRVLASLSETGLAKDTVVIFTADHGENLGEHGLWWKNCMYEHAARVPLIISWPARWPGGQRRTGACSLLDVVQTIAEIGGAAVPDGWDGDSMCAWMDNQGAAWKDLAVSEYYAHNVVSGIVMLRQGRYKYVYHVPTRADLPAERELYDLTTDPDEFVNLAGQPEHGDRIKHMRADLLAELGESPDRTDLRARTDMAQGYDRPSPSPRAAKPGRKTPQTEPAGKAE